MCILVNSRLKVKDYWLNGDWDVDLLHDLVDHTKAAKIVNEVGGNRGGLDLVVWKPNQDGVFTTASAWDVIRVRKVEVTWVEWLWQKHLPKKQLFAYGKQDLIVCLWMIEYVLLVSL
ncbi:hypothetical protein I3842_07G158800 [Carya illinoinensis]|uniref:Uncharacterized protein n=1 Tax=Carya illinoinensis TaxID=32201 RepID=A0A922JI01_CARIL|nr:hypothetical protein I3842_07G158800 [Carya illinoinensis]